MRTPEALSCHDGDSSDRCRGGEPAEDAAPVVTLSMREAALGEPGASERLIAAVTDAVAGVLGESVRERVAVLLVGMPPGRSGVGGEVS
ncbi:tautomerase family protein [Streptomyces sp. TS71-3]|uniref:tautomerase family protein n=1 Tax=Streptomyces sp. TS71-3 TaxID=2733862 RepID=UPI001BB3310E|nr:tautomerase family protein [Streptomyces sp. TS71-3]